MRNRNFVYPCSREDCISYKELILMRPSMETTTSFPSFLLSCLFCIHFERVDMLFPKRKDCHNQLCNYSEALNAKT
jgi:hypothetical protein